MQLTIKLQIVEIPTSPQYFLDCNICSCQRLLLNLLGLNPITKNLNEQVLVAIVTSPMLLAELEELLVLWVWLRYRLRSRLGHSWLCNLLGRRNSEIWWKLIHLRVSKRSVLNTRMRGWRILDYFRTYGPNSALRIVFQIRFFQSNFTINCVTFPWVFYWKFNVIRQQFFTFKIID